MDLNELEKLRAENELLRQEYLKLKNKQQTPRKPLSKGCMTGLIILIGGLVAIPILAIMAAIALPMYQQFKLKAEFSTQCLKLYDLAFHIKTSYEAGVGFPYDLNSLADFEKQYGLAFEGQVDHFEYSHDSETATFIFYFNTNLLRDRVITLRINCGGQECEPIIECSDSSLHPPPNPH